jgi:hypothetical protein
MTVFAPFVPALFVKYSFFSTVAHRPGVRTTIITSIVGQAQMITQDFQVGLLYEFGLIMPRQFVHVTTIVFMITLAVFAAVCRVFYGDYPAYFQISVLTKGLGYFSQ